jgi:hypothetical protein
MKYLKLEFVLVLLAIHASIAFGYILRAATSQDANVLIAEKFTIIDADGDEVQSFDTSAKYMFDIHGYYTTSPKQVFAEDPFQTVNY